MDRVLVISASGGDFRWTRRGDTGEHLATSHESYPDLQVALCAAREAHPGLPVRVSRASEILAAPEPARAKKTAPAVQIVQAAPVVDVDVLGEADEESDPSP